MTTEEMESLGRDCAEWLRDRGAENIFVAIGSGGVIVTIDDRCPEFLVGVQDEVAKVVDELISDISQDN